MHAFLRSQFPFTPYGTSIRNLTDIFDYIYANKNKGTVYSGVQAYIVRLTKKTVHQPIYCRLANEVYNYINNGKTETQVSFDNWHKQICEMFIFDCSKYGINVH